MKRARVRLRHPLRRGILRRVRGFVLVLGFLLLLRVAVARGFLLLGVVVRVCVVGEGLLRLGFLSLGDGVDVRVRLREELCEFLRALAAQRERGGRWDGWFGFDGGDGEADEQLDGFGRVDVNHLAELRHLPAGTDVGEIQTFVLPRVFELLRLEVGQDVLRRAGELFQGNPRGGIARLPDQPRVREQQAAPRSVLAHVPNLVLEALEFHRRRDGPLVVEPVLDLDEIHHVRQNLVRRPRAVDVVAHLRVHGPNRRVAEVVLGQSVTHVLLQVVVSNRQSRRDLRALLRGRELLVIDAPGVRIDESPLRPREHRRVIHLDDEHLIRAMARVRERLGLVMIVREPVQDPTLLHAILPLHAFLDEHHHEIVRHGSRRVEVPFRLQTELRGIVVRRLAKQRAGIHQRHVVLLREFSRGGGFPRRRGAHHGDAKRPTTVHARGEIPPGPAEPPRGGHRHRPRLSRRDRLLEPREPGFMLLVLEHDVVQRHRLAAILEAHLAARLLELRRGFLSAFVENLLGFARGDEVSSVLVGVGGVREKDVHGVESRGAHRRRARRVRLEHGHLPLLRQAFHLAGGGAVHHLDRGVLLELVVPLAVPDDDLGALQKSTLLRHRGERLVVHEGVMDAVEFVLLRRAGGDDEREPELVRELLQQRLERLLATRADGAGDDEGHGRRGHHRRMRARRRRLDVRVRQLQLLVHHDVGEKSLLLEPLHLPRDLIQPRGDLRVHRRERLLVILRGRIRGRAVLANLRRAKALLQRVHARGHHEHERAVRHLRLDGPRAGHVHVQDGNLTRVRHRLERLSRRPVHRRRFRRLRRLRRFRLLVTRGRLRLRVFAFVRRGAAARDVFDEFALGDVRRERLFVDEVVVRPVLLAVLGGARRVTHHQSERVRVFLHEHGDERRLTHPRGTAHDDRFRNFGEVRLGVLGRDDVRSLR